MSKFVLSLLPAVALLVAVSAAPAYANVNTSLSDQSDLLGRDVDNVIASLEEQGYSVQSLETWNSNVYRAFVVGDDGKTTSRFFDRDSLQDITAKIL